MATSSWLDSLNDIPTSNRPVESLAAAHDTLERIHPFLDGMAVLAGCCST